jgi:hypothetical protein
MSVAAETERDALDARLATRALHESLRTFN